MDVPRVRYEVATVRARHGVAPPIADAGPDQIGVPAGTITLNGSGILRSERREAHLSMGLGNSGRSHHRCHSAHRYVHCGSRPDLLVPVDRNQRRRLVGLGSHASYDHDSAGAADCVLHGESAADHPRAVVDVIVASGERHHGDRQCCQRQSAGHGHCASLPAADDDLHVDGEQRHANANRYRCRRGDPRQPSEHRGLHGNAGFNQPW